MARQREDRLDVQAPRAELAGGASGTRRRSRGTAILVAAAWLLTRAGLLIVALQALWQPSRSWLPLWVVGDVTGDYHQAARALASGLVPYRGFRYEYPPATLPFLAVAGIARSTAGFATAWVAMMAALDAVVTVLLLRLPEQRSRFGVWLWVVTPPLLGPFVYARNDLVVAASVAAAMHLHQARRPAASGALWMLAVLAKLWPIGPFVLHLATSTRPRRALVGASIPLLLTVAWLLGVGAFHDTWHQIHTYQGKRPLELESLGAVLLLLAAHGHHLREVLSFQSFNLVTPRARQLASVSYALTEAAEAAALVVGGWWLTTRRTPSPQALVWLTAAVVAAVVTVAPVLSPQYLLWILAAVAVATVLDTSLLGRCCAGLCAVAALLTQLEFPWRFDALLAQRQSAVWLVAIRDLTLVVVTAVCIVLFCVHRRSRPGRPTAG